MEPSQEFLKLISCPVTKKIFYNPALGADGEVYESEECLKKFPDKEIKIIQPLRSFVIAFLDKFPNFKKMQFQQDAEKVKTHLYNKEKINYDIVKKKYTNLKNYTNFSLKLFGQSIYTLCNDAPDDILIYIFENSTDIFDACILDKTDLWNLIIYNYQFRVNIIKYLIDKFDLNREDNEGNSKFHKIVQLFYNQKDIINHAIKKNPDYYKKNKFGSYPLYTILTTGIFENIALVLSAIDKKDSRFLDNIGFLIDFLDSNENIADQDKEFLRNCLLI